MTDYAIVIVPLSEEDGGGYVGYVPDLVGCMGDGATTEEAITDTAFAIDEWIDAATERGDEVPPPGTAADAAKFREDKLYEALDALMEASRSKDSEISDLKRKLSELIAVLKADSALSRRKFSNLEPLPSTKGSRVN